MGLADKTKGAKQGSTTPQKVFSGKLVLVVAHDAFKQSDMFPTNPDGSPKYQVLATVIPLEKGSSTYTKQDDTQVTVDFEAGDTHTVFLSGNVLRNQLLASINEPVLGRLGKGKATKGQPPWVLKAPTEEDFALLEKLDKELGLEAKVEAAVKAESTVKEAPPAASNTSQPVPSDSDDSEVPF